MYYITILGLFIVVHVLTLGMVVSDYNGTLHVAVVVECIVILSLI